VQVLSASHVDLRPGLGTAAAAAARAAEARAKQTSRKRHAHPTAPPTASGGGGAGGGSSRSGGGDGSSSSSSGAHSREPIELSSDGEDIFPTPVGRAETGGREVPASRPRLGAARAGGAGGTAETALDLCDSD
jgi:hypothetical protein